MTQPPAADTPLSRAHYRWIGLSAAIILVCQAALLGVVRALESFELLVDHDVLSEPVQLGIAMVLGFALGGFLSGRLSEGFTIWEPAVATVPAAAVFALLFSASFSPLALGALLVLGVVVGLVAATLGERAQGH